MPTRQPSRKADNTSNMNKLSLCRCHAFFLKNVQTGKDTDMFLHCKTYFSSYSNPHASSWGSHRLLLCHGGGRFLTPLLLLVTSQDASFALLFTTLTSHIILPTQCCHVLRQFPGTQNQIWETPRCFFYLASQRYHFLFERLLRHNEMLAGQKLTRNTHTHTTIKWIVLLLFCLTEQNLYCKERSNTVNTRDGVSRNAMLWWDETKGKTSVTSDHC